MLSTDQYAKVISSFFVELNHLLKHATEAELRDIPGFSGDIDEYLDALQDSTNDASATLYTAFGFVDEYASGANEEEVLKAGYEAYKLLCDRGEL